MGDISYSHPLDRLLNDNSIFMLEALIPFVDYNMKKVLVLFIKVRELSALMAKLNDPASLASCGFDCHVTSMDDMIDKMCDFMPPEFSNNIRQTIKMMNMMKMMEGMDLHDMNMNPAEMHDAPERRTDSTDIHDPVNPEEAADSQEGLFDSVMSILNDYDSGKHDTGIGE